MIKVLSLSCAMVILCAPASVTAQQATVEELERSCEESREARLAPLREAEIEKCKAEKAMEPTKCESYYKDYGDATRGAGGKYTERMFNDLPDCVKAREMKSKTREGTVSATKRGETTTDVDKTIKELTTTPEEAAATAIINQGKATPSSRDSTLGTKKRETEKPEKSRDSTLPDNKRDSTSGTSTR